MRPAARHLPGRHVGAFASAGPMGVPTGRANQGFFAAFTGTYIVGRGRIPGQALRTYLNGAGTSNTFLHGQVQVAIAVPEDPSGGLTGTASLFDKNYAQTGNILVLDLQASPLPGPDGRPTELSWTVGEGSSGTFTGAEGDGTLVISYHPGGRRPPHALDAGRMGIQLRGRLTVSGTTNSFQVH
jgi:hypothetical protein